MKFVTVSTHYLAAAVIAAPYRGVCAALADLATAQIPVADRRAVRFVRYVGVGRVGHIVAALMRDALKISVSEVGYTGTGDIAAQTLSAFLRTKYLPRWVPRFLERGLQWRLEDGRQHFAYALLSAPDRLIAVPVTSVPCAAAPFLLGAPDIVDALAYALQIRPSTQRGEL